MPRRSIEFGPREEEEREIYMMSDEEREEIIKSVKI